jgi:hypothetical protein
VALATYSDLQTEALDWMERSGQSGKAPTWIALAEARLNREIGAVETDGTITGTVDSRTIDISSLSMVQPIALWLAQSGLDERPVQLQANGTFAQLTTSGYPAMAAVVGDNLTFDCPLDQAYPFRLIYRQRFALSDSATTNWLLTNHPDVYLAATLMWGAGYNQDWTNGPIWKAVLDEAIPSIKSTIAANKRGVLRVDAGLLGNRRATPAELLAGEF